MRINPIVNYSYMGNNNRRSVSHKNPVFAATPKVSPEQLQEISDLKVFHHHVYEFKKGIRNLVLTTEKSKYRNKITEKLDRENIDYVIHNVGENKINVFFGEKPCVDVIKTITPELSKTTPEEDFILGILLGYDKVKQCVRYLGLKAKNQKK